MAKVRDVQCFVKSTGFRVERSGLQTYIKCGKYTKPVGYPPIDLTALKTLSCAHIREFRPDFTPTQILQTMNKTSIFIYSLYLAASLHISVAATQASATKLDAAPLPHDDKNHDFANGQEIIINEHATSYKRRPDSRELEKQHADDAAAAAKKREDDKKAAVDAALKAQQDRVGAYKEQLKVAVDSNNAAVNFGKQGRWLEAIAAHEKAVQYDSRNKQFRVNLSAAHTAYGQQLMASRDYTGAASNFRKALIAASDNGLAGKLLAEAIKKSGLDPGVADTRCTIGDQLTALGDLQGAAIEYQAAMQLDSTGKSLVKMGDLSIRYGQVAQAEQLYRQAQVKDPDYGAAYRQLGLLQLARRDDTGAASSLRKALILDSKDTAASQYLIEIWRKQVSNNPTLSENHLGLAGALQITGDFSGADTEYRKVEASEPNNPELAAGRASLTRAINHAKAEKYKMAFTTLFNQGLRKEAYSEIYQAVTIEPKNANYEYLLGECLEANGDYGGAHQAYLNCVLIDPENNKEAASRMKAMEGMQQQQGAKAPQQQQQTQQQMQAQQAPQQAPQQAQSPQTQAPVYRAGQQQGQQYYRPAQQYSAPQQGQQSAASPVNQSNNLSRKNMYEGGSGSIGPAAGMNFRTHDESENSAAPQSAATTSDAAPQVAQKVDSITRLNTAESQRDYAQAIAILQQMVNDNLQNSDMHHRLAVNLMSAGQMSEAISEFRIASALSPTQKTYADDLARAMAIHKKSLSSDGSGVPQ